MFSLKLTSGGNQNNNNNNNDNNNNNNNKKKKRKGRKGSEEKCKAFQSMASSFIVHRNAFKNY